MSDIASADSFEMANSQSGTLQSIKPIASEGNPIKSEEILQFVGKHKSKTRKYDKGIKQITECSK